MGLSRALAVASLAVALPGCFWFTTKQEGDALHHDVADLKGRVGKQEASLDERLKKLDDSLDKATKLLARNSADLGTDVEKLGGELATLRGTLDDLRRENADLRREMELMRDTDERRLSATETRVAEVEKQVATRVTPTGPATAPPAPAGPTATELFDSGVKRFGAGQLTDARRDFKDLLKRFPQDARADDAQFYLGEIAGREQTYDRAIGEYQKLIDGYPDGDMVDDAFYAAGLAAVELKWCTDGRAYFAMLLSKHPQSPLAKKAREKLDYLKKNARNKQVCQT